MLSERLVALPWLAVGVWLAVAGHDIGIGSARDPGSGSFIFWLGLIIAAMAGWLLWAPEAGDLTLRERLRATLRPRVMLATAATALYALLLEPIGFVLSTAAFLFALAQLVKPGRVLGAAIFAIVATLATYGFFRYLLATQLPAGILADR
ncbi:MAG: tripartite tricarboxylate transporter TctB family protein, partial [Pseudomonadota bacterium]